MNWNILLTSGKKIKRDSTISVNESRVAYTYTNNMQKKPYFIVQIQIRSIYYLIIEIKKSVLSIY